jgi:hypothetical protein
MSALNGLMLENPMKVFFEGDTENEGAVEKKVAYETAKLNAGLKIFEGHVSMFKHHISRKLHYERQVELARLDASMPDRLKAHHVSLLLTCDSFHSENANSFSKLMIEKYGDLRVMFAEFIRNKFPHRHDADCAKRLASTNFLEKMTDFVVQIQVICYLDLQMPYRPAHNEERDIIDLSDATLRSLYHGTFICLARKAIAELNEDVNR